MKAPQGRHDLVARYVGAVNHEDRKPDEMSKLEFWGMSLPFLRSTAKKYATLLQEFPSQKQWKLWFGVWNKTRNHDVRTMVLIWMSSKKNKSLRQENWKDLFAMATDVDNWALSDGLSSMLAEVLELNPKLIPHYKTWNKSKNPWERRQSIVGIYCYARLRKKHYPAAETLKLIETLLDDSHFYVQRAVGWTLREVDRVDPKLQRRFVKKHLHRISGVAWFATSELYVEKYRRELVQARKEKRSKT